jgi:CubicO group peptidase (beta-lactamase class C family)
VCGWDRRTYESACDARRSGTDVEHAGPCTPDALGERRPPDLAATGLGSGGLSFGAPDEQGLDARPLMALAEWIEREKLPIFSLLVSRNGVLVCELYTSGLTRDHAHYLMGATSSVTSALMGVAIDRHLVRSPETSLADALPASVFPSVADRERFRRVTIRDVLGMSALDAPVPPQDKSESGKERQRQFLASPNRTKFALSQPVLAEPGSSFQSTAITADLATGILEYAAHTSALELAEDALFGPMGFQNYEWMHQDKTGIDSGAYGLRLRPVDMQKVGVLYLGEGVWEGKRLLSSDWVRRSFSPWIRTTEGVAPDYGYYWSTVDYGTPTTAQAPSRWLAHVAQGWKGQRIAVFAEQGVVVTMTGILEPPEDETAIFRRVIRDHVMPSIDGTGAAPAHPDASLRAALEEVLERVRKAPLRLKQEPEPRMVPSIEPKEVHHAFRPE